MKCVRYLVAAALAIGVLAVVASPAGAVAKSSEKVAERHCVAVVAATEQLSSRQETASPETCFDSEAAVDSYLGDGVQRSSSNVIGRHYMGTSYTGSSITIVGTTCGGGVWYATGSWNNNIESTKEYCGSAGTRFYDSSSCSGSYRFVDADQATLGWMNNRTSCVRYG